MARRFWWIVTSRHRSWLRRLWLRLRFVTGEPADTSLRFRGRWLLQPGMPDVAALRDLYLDLIQWRDNTVVGLRPGEDLFEDSDDDKSDEGDEDKEEDKEDKDEYQPDVDRLDRILRGEDPDADSSVGAFDQKRVEAARPGQTEQWYRERQHKTLINVRNVGNNLCLELAIAAHRKQVQLRQRSWDEKQKREGKELSVKQRVVHASLSGPTQRCFANYLRSCGRKSEWYKDARQLAVMALGENEAKADRPRRLADLVKYHNKLECRLQVFTFQPDGTRPQRVYASWEQPGAADLAENADLVSFVWTPEPPLSFPGPRIGHFDLVPASCDLAVAYLGAAPGYRQCPVCLTTFSRQTGHKCQMFCAACGQFGCPNRTGRVGEPQRCDSCHRCFFGATCFANHSKPLPPRAVRPLLQTIDAAQMQVEVPLEQGPDHPQHRFVAKAPRFSMCESLFDCPNCGPGLARKVKVLVDGKIEYVDHRCGWEVCAHCRQFLAKTHECYVRQTDWREPGEPESYVCVDIECDTRGYHAPYLIRACVGLGARDGETRNLGGWDEKGRHVGATPEGNYTEDGKQVGCDSPPALPSHCGEDVTRCAGLVLVRGRRLRPALRRVAAGEAARRQEGVHGGRAQRLGLRLRRAVPRDLPGGRRGHAQVGARDLPRQPADRHQRRQRRAAHLVHRLLPARAGGAGGRGQDVRAQGRAARGGPEPGEGALPAPAARPHVPRPAAAGALLPEEGQPQGAAGVRGVARAGEAAGGGRFRMIGSGTPCLVASVCVASGRHV